MHWLTKLINELTNKTNQSYVTKVESAWTGEGGSVEEEHATQAHH